MGLPEIYEKVFGAKVAAEKQAEGDEAAQAANADAGNAAEAEMTDAELETALGKMTEDELKALATEVAADVKESQAKAEGENQKVAEEYYAAGRIFAQGFISELKGTEKTANGKATATEKFAGLLDAELKKGAEKK